MSQQLDPRLALLLEMTPRCSLAADIGTDHGYLICSLMEQRRVEHGIAADINPQPLDKARREAARRGLNDRISFCLTDGLSGISPAGLEVVIIAGMGGETILHIIESWPHFRDPGIVYLLQPMTKAQRLRCRLWELGFSLRRERCCTAAGRVYSVMEVAFTGEVSTHPLWEQHLGSIDPAAGPNSRRYALERSRELQKIAAGLRVSGEGEALLRAAALEEAAAVIREKAGEGRGEGLLHL